MTAPGQPGHNENQDTVVYSATAFKQKASVLFQSLGPGCGPHLLACVGAQINLTVLVMAYKPWEAEQFLLWALHLVSLQDALRLTESFFQERGDSGSLTWGAGLLYLSCPWQKENLRLQLLIHSRECPSALHKELNSEEEKNIIARGLCQISKERKCVFYWVLPLSLVGERKSQVAIYKLLHI